MEDGTEMRQKGGTIYRREDMEKLGCPVKEFRLYSVHNGYPLVYSIYATSNKVLNRAIYYMT